MVVVNLTRSRAENLGNIARGLDTAAARRDPGRRPAPRATASTASPARSPGVLRSTAPTSRRTAGCSGSTRPEPLPDVVAAWARDAAPARNADGFLTAPGMFSPEHDRCRQPPARRRASTPGSPAASPTSAPAGAGSRAPRCEQCPAITELDLYEAEALALDAARVNVTDPRARFHWTDATGLGAGVAALRRGDREPALPPGPRRRARPRRRLHRSRPRAS